MIFLRRAVDCMWQGKGEHHSQTLLFGLYLLRTFLFAGHGGCGVRPVRSPVPQSYSGTPSSIIHCLFCMFCEMLNVEPGVSPLATTPSAPSGRPALPLIWGCGTQSFTRNFYFDPCSELFYFTHGRAIHDCQMNMTCRAVLCCARGAKQNPWHCCHTSTPRGCGGSVLPCAGNASI